jgi:ribosomal protein S21
MGVRIQVRDGEPISEALRRLKRESDACGATWEARRRSYHVRATEERRAKRFQRRFKARRAILLAQIAGVKSVASVAEAKARFWKRTGKP